MWPEPTGPPGRSGGCLAGSRSVAHSHHLEASAQCGYCRLQGKVTPRDSHFPLPLQGVTSPRHGGGFYAGLPCIRVQGRAMAPRSPAQKHPASSATHPHPAVLSICSALSPVLPKLGPPPTGPITLEGHGVPLSAASGLQPRSTETCEAPGELSLWPLPGTSEVKASPEGGGPKVGGLDFHSGWAVAGPGAQLTAPPRLCVLALVPHHGAVLKARLSVTRRPVTRTHSYHISS